MSEEELINSFNKLITEVEKIMEANDDVETVFTAEWELELET